MKMHERNKKQLQTKEEVAQGTVFWKCSNHPPLPVLCTCERKSGAFPSEPPPPPPHLVLYTMYAAPPALPFTLAHLLLNFEMYSLRKKERHRLFFRITDRLDACFVRPDTIARRVDYPSCPTSAPGTCTVAIWAFWSACSCRTTFQVRVMFLV